MKKSLQVTLILALTLLIAAAAVVYVVMAQKKGDSMPTVSAPTASPEAAATPEFGDGDVVTIDATTEDTDVNPIYKTAPKTESVVNILLLGCDSRRLTETSHGNADTIMMVSLNKETKVATLVSFVRDSYMQLQGDNSRYWNKLNAAYAHGGFGRMINTLNADYNYGLDIQYYVGVGFRNFEKLVDSIGGVEIDLTADECYYINWRYAGLLKTDAKTKRLELLAADNKPALPEKDGTYQLNGAQALWYARDRSTGDGEKTSGNDFLRTGRQQRVIELVYNKVRTDMTLKNLVSIAQYTMDNAATNMTLDKLIEVGAFLFATDLTIKKVTVPEEGNWSYADVVIPPAETESSVVRFDIDEARAYLEEQLYGAAEAGVKNAE